MVWHSCARPAQCGSGSAVTPGAQGACQLTPAGVLARGQRLARASAPPGWLSHLTKSRRMPPAQRTQRPPPPGWMDGLPHCEEPESGASPPKAVTQTHTSAGMQRWPGQASSRDPAGRRRLCPPAPTPGHGRRRGARALRKRRRPAQRETPARAGSPAWRSAPPAPPSWAHVLPKTQERLWGRRAVEKTQGTENPFLWSPGDPISRSRGRKTQLTERLLCSTLWAR